MWVRQLIKSVTNNFLLYNTNIVGGKKPFWQWESTTSNPFRGNRKVQEDSTHIHNLFLDPVLSESFQNGPSWIAVTAEPRLPLLYYRWCMTVTAPIRRPELPKIYVKNRIEKLVPDVLVKVETKEEAMNGLTHVQPKWFSSLSTRQTSALCLRV